MTQTSPAANAAENRQPVAVTLTITNQGGETQTETKTLESGPTGVTALKSELGVPPDSALWLIEGDGKKRPLGDHETVNVKEGDHFEALVRGGVS